MCELLVGRTLENNLKAATERPTNGNIFRIGWIASLVIALDNMPYDHQGRFF